MLELMEKVFTERFASAGWQAKLKEIIPSFGTELNGDIEAADAELRYTSQILGLKCDESLIADITPPVQKPALHPQSETVADIAL